MKDGKTQNQIAKLMDRHKSTISRELSRNTGNRYPPKQCCLLSEAHSKGLRNASQITPEDLGQIVDYLEQQWSPEQIAHHVGISYETIHHHAYADKAAGKAIK